MRIRTAVGRALTFSAILSLVLASDALASPRLPPPGWQPPRTTSWTGAVPKHAVILVIDGGVPGYLTLGDFPHLAALEAEGTQYTNAWSGILESETPTGHATLGTGSYPRRHGIISFAWANDRGTVTRPTDPVPIQQGELESLLRRSGVPSIASRLKEHDRNARVVVTSGHKDYAVDAAGGWAADYLMYYGFSGQTWVPKAIPRHVPPRSVMDAPGLTAYAPRMGAGDQDSLAVHLAMSAFRDVRQTVTIINLPEFDWPLGHLDGGLTDRHFAWQLMNRLDGDIGYIETVLKHEHALKNTVFVLTADHGMVPLRHNVPYLSIENAVRAAGTSLIRRDFHTAAYLWLRDPTRAPVVADTIMRLNNPYIRAAYYLVPGQTSYQHAPGSRGMVAGVEAANQYLLQTMAGSTAPQVVLVLRENTSVHGTNQVGWKGDHGGPNWGAQHIPLILSGPGIRQGIVSHYPAALTDISPTVLHLLGASSSGMDGVALADAMLQPSDADVAQQTLRGRTLTPYVDALMRQSKADGP